MGTIRTVKIQTDNRHIDHTFSNLPPVEALEEIIFNSLDASANKIDILIKEDQLNAVITEICIVDNGKGIPRPDENSPDDPFLKLGFSGKRFGQTNDFNRAIHGKNGEGRFKALSLGDIVEWKTKTNTDSTIIKLKSDSPLEPEITDNAVIPELKSDTGTVFIAYPNGKDVKLPKNDILKNILERFFLTIIEDKNISITLNGQTLSVSEHIETEKESDLPSPNNNTKVKVIIWKNTDEINNKCFWCDKDYNTLLEDRLEDRKTTNHSVYIASDEIAKAYNEKRLGLWDMDGHFVDIKNAAKELKTAFLLAHDNQRAEDIISVLKQESIYPYSEEVKLTETEKQIKDVYDEILVKLNKAKPAVFKAGKEIKKNIINTLKVVIEKDPENFKIILESIAGLSPEEVQSFSDLLKRVSLSSVIKASALVLNRLDFIEGLRQIAYGDFSKIKERSQLHKIIEKETWIFGEQFNFMTSDKSINTIISALRDNASGFIGTDIEGGSNIPDLFFANQGYDGDIPRALIVELKRPSVKIGLEEMTQISRYYNSIKKSPQFVNYQMDIIIISSDIKEESLGYISEKSTGLLSYCSETPSKRLYIRRWSDIITKNEAALNKMKLLLNANVGKEEGINYLQQNHAKFLNKK